MTRQIDFLGRPCRSFSQAQGDVTADIRPATDTRTRTAAAKEVLENRSTEQVAEGFEDVAHVVKTASVSIDSRVPILVVASSLGIIAEHFVGFSGFLEFGDSFLIVRIAIRVILDRQLAISLGQVGGGDPSLHP